MTAQKDQDAPRRPGRPRGKKPGTANREQLMDIALTLFARDGAGRVSLNAIAKEAGVTPAMLHYYFSSRDALVTQLIEERFMPLRNHISRIFVDHPQDPVLALTMMVETLGHMAEKTPGSRRCGCRRSSARCRFCASIWMPASARSVFR